MADERTAFPIGDPVAGGSGGRRLTAAVLATVLALWAGGCGTDPAGAAGGERPTVLTTLTILADFTEAVAGDAVTVESLVATGEDPHTYEPTPSAARRLDDAALVLRNGLGLEPWLEPLLVHAGAPVVTVTEGLTAAVEDAGPFAGRPDPHLWMDPVLAGDYVRAIRDALATTFPDRAEGFAAGAETYLAELDALDAWIRGEVARIPAERRKLVTSHDAFRYFGDRYGLEVVGTLWGISTELEPSAAELRALVDAVREQRVPTVFAETTISPRLLRRVARDAGVAMGAPLYGDSVGEPGSGADTYLGMMRANVRAVVDGLADAPDRGR